LITFNDSEWPLLTVSFSGTSSAQEFEAYLARMTAYLNRRETYLAILDSSKASNAPTLEQRQRQVEWLQKHDAALRQRSLGSAFVITSPFIRLALNIMCQLKPLSCPHTIVGDMKVARAWAAERFQAARLPLPFLLLRNGEGLAATGTQGPR
jgi:hypothetical protein